MKLGAGGLLTGGGIFVRLLISKELSLIRDVKS